MLYSLLLFINNRRRSFLHNNRHIAETISNYLQETSIHGCFYLQNGRNLAEKLIWSLIIILGLTFSSVMIHKTIQEANDSPILTNIDTIEVSEIPFPAITIGPDNEVNSWGFLEKSLNWLAFYSDDRGKMGKHSFITSCVFYSFYKHFCRFR